MSDADVRHTLKLKLFCFNSICIINVSCFFIWQLLQRAHGWCQTKIRPPSFSITALERSCTIHRGAEQCHALLIEVWPNPIKARDNSPFHHARENNSSLESLEYDIKCLIDLLTIWRPAQAVTNWEAKHAHVLHAAQTQKVDSASCAFLSSSPRKNKVAHGDRGVV